MKKMISILVFMLVMISACGNTDSNVDQKDEKGAESQQLTIYGGSVGGVWSTFTEGVSEAVRREYPGTQISAMPGTVAGNSILVDQGKADFVIAESLTARLDRKSTRLNSSHVAISYAVFCLKKKIIQHEDAMSN